MGLKLDDMTCEARVLLCAAIVSHASRDVRLGTGCAPSPALQRLDAALAARPFETMTLDQISDMAVEFGVPEERVAAIVVKSSNEFSRVEARFLCGTCLDQQVVPSGDDRFARCPTCNGGPVPFNPREDIV